MIPFLHLWRAPAFSTMLAFLLLVLDAMEFSHLRGLLVSRFESCVLFAVLGTAFLSPGLAIIPHTVRSN
jgi:hypothetical protein